MKDEDLAMQIPNRIVTPEEIENMVSVTEMEKMASGMQSKVFDQAENVWYKQDYLGTEGLSEYVASKLLKGSGVEYTSYIPCQFMMGHKEVVGCKSENFLRSGERLVSTYELLENEFHIDIAKEISHIEDIKDRINFFVDKVVEASGYEEFGSYLSGLLRLDAITKNDDRHFNNISLIRNENGEYRPAPIYDNGGAFLSDKYTYGEHLTEDQVLYEMDHVMAKPFSMNFDEQLDACEALYPCKLTFNKNTEIDEVMLSHYYEKDDINIVKTMVAQAQRKYSYMFETHYEKDR